MSKLFLIFLLFAQLLPFPGIKTKVEEIAAKRISETRKTVAAKFEPQIIKVPRLTGGGGEFTDGKANYSIDLASGTVLSQNNAETKLEIASITKLMTAYITLKDLPLDKTITVPVLKNHKDDSVMGLSTGDELAVRDLLYGLLINSGSDAAQTLAIADSGSIEEFVDKMNGTAERLGLSSTHYANPVGWDDPQNYSTAKDVAILARILIRNNEFANIVKTKSTTVRTKGGKPIPLSNTNLLLDNPAFTGVKTGYTFSAGECLVALNKKDDHEILTVILGSKDRFGRTSAYLDWIYSRFSW